MVMIRELNLGINVLTPFSPFMDTSPDGRDKRSLTLQSIDSGVQTRNRRFNYAYYNSVYRRESQSEYGVFVV